MTMPRDVCAQNTVVDVPSRVLRVKVKDTADGLSPRQKADLFRDNPALLFFCGLGALVPVSVADGKTGNIVSVADGKTGNIVSVADGKTGNIVSVADGNTSGPLGAIFFCLFAFSLCLSCVCQYACQCES